MRIFSDGVYAHSELVNGVWRWVIDEFTDDNFTAFVGEDDDIYANVESGTEERLFAGYVNPIE